MFWLTKTMIQHYYFRLQNGVHGIQFMDFTLEACRGDGIHGYNNRDIRVTNMEIRNTGSEYVIELFESLYILHALYV